MALFLASFSGFAALASYMDQKHQMLPTIVGSIPPMIICCLLFSEIKTRIFFLAWTVGLTLLFWVVALKVDIAAIPDMGYGWTYPILGTIIPIFIYIAFRDLMQRELEQESDWQARSVRLNEVNSMTKSMYALMKRPLNHLDRYWKDFYGNTSFEDEAIQDEIAKGLDELIEVSRSFGWIYRAYRNEGTCVAPSSQLFQNLQTLISQKIEDSGWELQVLPANMDAEIRGPIPSMMLLIFTIVVQIIELSELQQMKFLELQLAQRENRVNWLLSWPSEKVGSILAPRSPGQKEPSITTLRGDLIQDLRESCQANFLEYEERGSRFFQISGDWIHLDKSLNRDPVIA